MWWKNLVSYLILFSGKEHLHLFFNVVINAFWPADFVNCPCSNFLFSLKYTHQYSKWETNATQDPHFLFWLTKALKRQGQALSSPLLPQWVKKISALSLDLVFHIPGRIRILFFFITPSRKEFQIGNTCKIEAVEETREREVRWFFFFFFFYGHLKSKLSIVRVTKARNRYMAVPVLDKELRKEHPFTFQNKRIRKK